jgi:hypothetical protein
LNKVKRTGNNPSNSIQKTTVKGIVTTVKQLVLWKYSSLSDYEMQESLFEIKITPSTWKKTRI